VRACRLGRARRRLRGGAQLRRRRGRPRLGHCDLAGVQALVLRRHLRVWPAVRVLRPGCSAPRAMQQRRRMRRGGQRLRCRCGPVQTLASGAGSASQWLAIRAALHELRACTVTRIEQAQGSGAGGGPGPPPPPPGRGTRAGGRPGPPPGARSSVALPDTRAEPTVHTVTDILCKCRQDAVTHQAWSCERDCIEQDSETESERCQARH